MNPVLFDPSTTQQWSEAFVTDLLYYPEIDHVRSMHNSLAGTEKYVPPPQYYPTSTGFFSKDPLAAYKSLDK